MGLLALFRKRSDLLASRAEGRTSTAVVIIPVVSKMERGGQPSFSSTITSINSVGWPVGSIAAINATWDSHALDGRKRLDAPPNVASQYR